jgi:dethiobiotin synthetase
MADVVIVEGAGGFLVPLNSAPLNEAETMADLAAVLNIPIILVVGMKLGCINHSLLTVEAIKSRNLQLHGWVANQIEPNMPMFEENEASLAARIKQPKLFSLGYLR